MAMPSRLNCAHQQYKEKQTRPRAALAEKLSVPKPVIILERGERSRDKVIHVDGLSEEDIRRDLHETG